MGKSAKLWASICTIFGGFLWIIRFISDLDFIVSRSQDPGWMMGIPAFFQSVAIPDWLIGGLFVLALFLVWYVVRAPEIVREKSATDSPPKTLPDNKPVSTKDDVSEPSPLISLTDLMREAEEQGWRFTDDGSQHIFDFVRALRDAGSTKAIQFWGREKQRIESMTKDRALSDIDPKYWRKFKIDGISCLEISHSTGETQGIASDNLKTTTEADGNLTQHGLYADIHLDRAQAVSWLRSQVVPEQPAPIRDIALFSVIMRVAYRAWDWEPFLNAVEIHHNLVWTEEAVESIQQKMADDNLPIWGSSNGSAIHLVEPHDLRLARIADQSGFPVNGPDGPDASTLLVLFDDPKELRLIDVGTEKRTYSDLWTSKQTVDRLWPLASGPMSEHTELASTGNKRIPLSEAVIDAYHQTPQSFIATLARESGNIAKYYAHEITRHGGVKLYGRMPPSREIVDIPAKDAQEFMFSDDANELHDQFHEQIKYVNLEISMADLARKIKDINDWRDRG